MCQASLLSSTANYQCQGVQRVALWPYHAVVCLQGQNIGELIFNSPKLGSEFPPISFSTCLMESKLPFPLPAAAMHSASSPPFHGGKSLSAGVLSYLEPVEVSWFEVIGWAATPVHNVLVLTLAAQLPVPVGDAQVVVHHGVAERAVLQHGVKEGLQQTGNRSPYLAPQTSSNFHFLLHFSSWAQIECRWPIFVWNDRINKLYCSATYGTHSMGLYSIEHGKITTLYRPNPAVRTHSWGLAPITWHKIIALLQWPALGIGSPKDSRKGTSASNHFIFISAIWAILRNAHYFPSVSCSLV